MSHSNLQFILETKQAYGALYFTYKRQITCFACDFLYSSIDFKTLIYKITYLHHHFYTNISR